MPGISVPRPAFAEPSDSDSVAGTVPLGVPVATATTLYVTLLVVVLPAASFAVTVTVCGPTWSGAVGRFAPLAIATPRSVAVQETTVWSSSQENASATGVPCGICAPSSGDVIEIVGASASVTPLSSNAWPWSRPVPTPGLVAGWSPSRGRRRRPR